MSMSKRVVRRVPSLRRGPASIVMACAGQIASHSLLQVQGDVHFHQSYTYDSQQANADEYGQLDTKIHLPTYLRLKDDPSNAKARTQTALFDWSHLDPNEILRLGRPKEQGETDEDVQRRLDERSVLLESASFELSGDWTNWWTGEGHKLVFSADGEYLTLRVSDKDNPFLIPFGERSRGFQWFFSFYLVFLVESRKAHKDAILLLDEPGLHLHPHAPREADPAFRAGVTAQPAPLQHPPSLPC